MIVNLEVCRKMEVLARMVGIKPLDADYISSLLDDLDKLGLDYPNLIEIIDYCGFADLTNDIIAECLYLITEDFISKVNDYLKDDDVTYRIHTNYMASYIDLCVNGIHVDEYIIRNTYIDEGIEEAYRELKEALAEN